MSELEKKRLRKRVFLWLLLVLIVLGIFLVGSLVGQYALSYQEIAQAFLGRGSVRANLVLFDIRLPRLVLALFVGMGMGSSGVVMQKLLGNDLASPGTLGVADGSSLFVTLYMVLLADKLKEPIFLPFLALLGGMLSAGIIYRLSHQKHQPMSPIRLILTGVAMSAVYSTISSILVYVLDEQQLEFLQRWQSGDLWGVEWSYIAILAGWLAVFGLVLFLQSRQLDAIEVGHDFATGLGVSVKSSFTLLAFLAIGLASASVAFGGNFFFLGLIGPHIARGLVGRDSRFLLPAASLVSAILLTSSTFLVENVHFLVNLPPGIVISILSVPYFLYLLIKAR